MNRVTFLQNTPFGIEHTYSSEVCATSKRSSRGLLANVLDWHIVVSEFVHLSDHLVHLQTDAFRRDMRPFIRTSFGLTIATTVILQRYLWH